MSSLIDLLPATGAPTAVRRTVNVDWRLLLGALASIKQEITEPEKRRDAATAVVEKILQADYAAFVLVADDGKTQSGSEQISATLIADVARAAATVEAQKAIKSGKSSASAWLHKWNVIAAQAVDVGGQQVLVVIVPSAINVSLVSAVLQLVALSLRVEVEHAEQSGKTDNASTLAAGLELVVRLTDAADTKTAAKMICDLVQRQLKAEHVAVGLAKQSATTVEPIAISDCAILDRKSAMAQLLADCLTESLPQSPFVTWSESDEVKPVGLGRWQQLADSWQAAELTAIRCMDRSGNAVAVCLVASTVPLDAAAEQFLLLLGHVAGPLLRVLERAAHGRRIQDFLDSAPTWFKGRRACALLAVVSLPLLYPWCARTTCSVVLEPIAHRIVAAPYEGVFDRSLVKPGDRVEAGQVLGRMDGRELRARLAGSEADLTRAAKSRDVNLAAGKLGGAQIDRLEMERLQHERDVVQRRLEQLEIRSPIAGIVVTGDLTRFETATLSIGQTLYEIAPLDRFAAELAVPEEELENVADGAELSIVLDAVPGAAWDGAVERIRPRGELRDNLQVFVAETTLADPAEKLRPGMKGLATILGPRAPGIWHLLRKPWYATRRFLGW